MPIQLWGIRMFNFTWYWCIGYRSGETDAFERFKQSWQLLKLKSAELLRRLRRPASAAAAAPLAPDPEDN